MLSWGRHIRWCGESTLQVRSFLTSEFRPLFEGQLRIEARLIGDVCSVISTNGQMVAVFLASCALVGVTGLKDLQKWLFWTLWAATEAMLWQARLFPSACQDISAPRLATLRLDMYSVQRCVPKTHILKSLWSKSTDRFQHFDWCLHGCRISSLSPQKPGDVTFMKACQSGQELLTYSKVLPNKHRTALCCHQRDWPCSVLSCSPASTANIAILLGAPSHNPPLYKRWSNLRLYRLYKCAFAVSIHPSLVAWMW